MCFAIGSTGWPHFSLAKGPGRSPTAAKTDGEKTNRRERAVVILAHHGFPLAQERTDGEAGA